MDDSTDESDYNVELHVKPDKIRKPVNDESADLLGNFDDVKRKEIMDGTYEEKQRSDDEESSTDEEMEEDSEDDAEEVGSGNEAETLNEGDNAGIEEQESAPTQNPFGKKSLTKDQLDQLRKGSSKVNRYVLYVTNLSFETTKHDLENHFGDIGSLRSVRIPKKRSGGFAFVEMNDLESYHKGFEQHNTELNGRWIKVQFSEGGKKKSANKKNIMKQKNRKLAEMRNENKTFTKSGKFFDKDLKKEKASKVLANKRWQKKAMGGAGGRGGGGAGGRGGGGGGGSGRGGGGGRGRGSGGRGRGGGGGVRGRGGGGRGRGGGGPPK